jgi:thiol-disulfide isomerase/thioredoxin
LHASFSYHAEILTILGIVMMSLKQTKIVLAFLALCILASAAPAFSAPAEFKLKDMSGQEHKLSDYRGKWVLLNFWATWCPPCLEEMPDLVLYDKRKQQNLMVIGIAQDYQSEKQVRDFVDDMLVSYPIVLSNDSVRAQLGKIELLPTTMIYNPQGQLVFTKRGAISRKQIEQVIDGPSNKRGP